MRGQPKEANAMSADSSDRKIPTILLIAASRGPDLAMAAEFLKKVGTGLEYLDYLGRTVPW
jgi:hypothetical protein